MLSIGGYLISTMPPQMKAKLHPGSVQQISAAPDLRYQTDWARPSLVPAVSLKLVAGRVKMHSHPAEWTGMSAIMTVHFHEYKDSTGLVRLPVMLSIQYSMVITTSHCGKDNWLRHTRLVQQRRASSWWQDL